MLGNYPIDFLWQTMLYSLFLVLSVGPAIMLASVNSRQLPGNNRRMILVYEPCRTVHGTSEGRKTVPHNTASNIFSRRQSRQSGARIHFVATYMNISTPFSCCTILKGNSWHSMNYNATYFFLIFCGWKKDRNYFSQPIVISPCVKCASCWEQSTQYSHFI